MREAPIQRFVNNYLWNFRGVENPNIPISGATIQKLWGKTENSTGEQVSPDTALTLSAVYRANRILCDTVASLGVSVYEKTGNGRQVAVDHDINYLISKEPNSLMTSFSWREAMQANLSMHGNAYSEIKRKGVGVNSLDFIQAPYVEPIVKGNKIVYRVYESQEHYEKKEKYRLVKAENMVHVPNFGFSGLKGKPTLELAAESLGGSLIQQKYSNRFFANSSQPNTAFIFKGNIKEDQKKQFRETNQELQSGENQHKAMVLGGEWDVKTFSIPPEQAQFLETRKFGVIDVARWFGVQPHLLFDLDRATFSNIEHQGIEYVTYTIMGIVKRYEMEFDRKLFSTDEKRKGKYFVKFNLNSLLRADAKSRAEYYQILSNIGAYSTNDILELEDRNSIGEEGDLRTVNSAQIPLDQIRDFWSGRNNGE